MTDIASYSDLVGSTVRSKIMQLQHDYLANRPYAVAALARLRRGLGKPAGSVLDILEFTHDGRLVGDSRSDEPTAGEIAAHLCLTLYASHQQSQGQSMHRDNHRLGRAIRSLIPPDRSDYTKHAVASRFAMLGTADSVDELTHHLRGIVQLLRSHAVPLDYGRLAADLHRWRTGHAASVRLVWGRDFHRTTNKTAPTA